MTIFQAICGQQDSQVVLWHMDKLSQIICTWRKETSMHLLQVFWIHTFKQLLEDKANTLDKCDVLFYSFLGDGMFSCILLQACFALVEEIRTIIDQCAVPVECLKIWGCRKYIIQGLLKQHVLVLHLASPSFTKLFVHYSAVWFPIVWKSII